MTALVGRIGKRTVSGLAGYSVPCPGVQAEQAAGQDGTDLGPAFGRRQAGGVERIRQMHGTVPMSGFNQEKPLRAGFRDIAKALCPIRNLQ